MNTEVVILGGGITGLTAGMELQERAVVLEKDNRPGGVVKTFCFDGGYWFDNVVHLLHFRKEETKNMLMLLMGDVLKQCPPVGWVETSEGRTRYPFQFNLGGLNRQARTECFSDFMRKGKNTTSSSYKDFLLNTFGKSMCEIFFFPYNEKLWKYPLDKMTSSGQVWNISQPSFQEILRGIRDPNKTRNSYNLNGYYPQPKRDSAIRGMEILSKTLADRVFNLKLGCEVYYIDTRAQDVWTKDGMYHYENNCLSTIPLPRLMYFCEVPSTLKKEVDKLKWIKVISVGISVVGRRPQDSGHWHYYADPKIPFTKVIYMTEFDEYNAPKKGFGLLIEVPVSSKNQTVTKILLDKVISDLYKLKILNESNEVIGVHAWYVDPAYVIFTKETPRIVENCKEYLEKFNITTLGRYGNWEYSSMAENIEDGLNYARKIINK